MHMSMLSQNEIYVNKKYNVPLQPRGFLHRRLIIVMASQKTTTMIYTHVLQQGGFNVKSFLDNLDL
jgi:hypothetical protein